MKVIISSLVGITTFILGFFAANWLIGIITSGLVDQTLAVVKILLWVLGFGTILTISVYTALILGMAVYLFLEKRF